MTKKFKIIILISSIAFIILSVFILLQAHYYHLLEMNAQIETIGFYKNDVIVLIENDIKFKWCIVAALVSLITGVGAFIFDLVFWKEWE